MQESVGRETRKSIVLDVVLVTEGKCYPRVTRGKLLTLCRGYAEMRKILVR